MTSPFLKYIAGSNNDLEVQRAIVDSDFVCHDIDDTLGQYTEFQSFLRLRPDFCRVLFAGEPGSGKKTLLALCLRHLREKQPGTQVTYLQEPNIDDEQLWEKVLLDKLNLLQRDKLNSLDDVSRLWNADCRLVIVISDSSPAFAAHFLNRLSLVGVHILVTVSDKFDVRVVTAGVHRKRHPVSTCKLGYVCRNSVKAFIEFVVANPKENSQETYFTLEHGLSDYLADNLVNNKPHLSMHHLCRLMNAICEAAIISDSTKLTKDIAHQAMFQAYSEQQS
ncbi:MAG: hypothetical protein AAFR71_02610 [Pseudomonadota bacterium]